MQLPERIENKSGAAKGAKKILVVDDSATLVSWLEKKLTAEGYRVFTAGNGKEGFAVANREVPDLIVSDVDMPLMDGGEMVSKLKGLDRTRHIPIIFLTALIKKDEGGQPASGEALYISKMSKPAELLTVIRDCLALIPK